MSNYGNSFISDTFKQPEERSVHQPDHNYRATIFNTSVPSSHKTSWNQAAMPNPDKTEVNETCQTSMNTQFDDGKLSPNTSRAPQPMRRLPAAIETEMSQTAPAFFRRPLSPAESSHHIHQLHQKRRAAED